MKKNHLLPILCLLFLGLSPHFSSAQTEDPPCIHVYPAHDNFEAIVDTVAERMLHPFLFAGCTFQENGVHKFIYPFPIPDNGTNFILVKARQNGVIEWTKTYGDLNFKDAASCIQPTSDGNFILVGTSESISNNKNYPFLMKIDPAGNIIWQKSYPKGHNLGRMQVVELNNGDLAVCGYHNPWKYSETHEMVTILTDANGNIINYNQFGNNGRSWDHLRGITATQNGGFAVCGTNGHAGDYVGGLIIQFDGGGNMVWETIWQLNSPTGTWNLNSSNPNDRRRLFLTDIIESYPHLYVAGHIDNGKANGSQSTFRKGFIGEVLPGGAQGWTFHYHVDSTHSVFNNLAATSDTGFVAVGKTKVGGQQRTWLLKVGMMGMPEFSHVYGGGNQEFGAWIDEGQDKSLIVTGFRRSTSSNLDYRAYHMRTDSAGKGNHLCLDTAAVVFDHHPHHPTEQFNTYTNATPNDHINLLVDSSCISIWDCLDFPGKANSDDFTLDQSQSSWEVYPNPGRSLIMISSGSGSGSEENAQISVLDLTGRVLHNTSYTGGVAKLDISDLPAAIYLIQIQEKDRVQTVKWIKE